MDYLNFLYIKKKINYKIKLYRIIINYNNNIWDWNKYLNEDVH